MHFFSNDKPDYWYETAAKELLYTFAINITNYQFKLNRNLAFKGVKITCPLDSFFKFQFIQLVLDVILRLPPLLKNFLEMFLIKRIHFLMFHSSNGIFKVSSSQSYQCVTDLLPVATEYSIT